MSLATTTQAIADRVGDDTGLGATLKLDLGDDGVIVLDATTVPNRVHNEPAEADCTIKITLRDLEDLIGKRLDPMSAFAAGKIQFEGDPGVAMKLGSILG